MLFLNFNKNNFIKLYYKMSLSFKNISTNLKSIPSVFKNQNLTNFILFLSIALSIGYLVNKSYHAIVMLYIIAVFMYFICKNVACALGISIILTNLFLALNDGNIKENFDKNLLNDLSDDLDEASEEVKEEKEEEEEEEKEKEEEDEEEEERKEKRKQKRKNKKD
tara:strand:+ start:2197 stop:2691 length:495 start_codon:yes stop_codon:yes gene_type:complete